MIIAAGWRIGYGSGRLPARTKRLVEKGLGMGCGCGCDSVLVAGPRPSVGVTQSTIKLRTAGSAEPSVASVSQALEAEHPQLGASWRYDRTDVGA